MEKSRILMKPINGNQQHPMFDMEEPSPPFVLLPPKTITIRDASFSSYLRPPQQQQLHNQVDDNELSIFDAQKYFNESSSSNSNSDARVSNRVSPVKVYLESIPRFSSASSSLDGYGRNYRARSFHATPTASSEASWNSQTGLLSNPPGAIAVSMQNPHPGDEKKKGSAKKWFLSRRCPCAGKKSVQVEEKLSDSTTPSHLTHKHKDPKNVERQNPACEEKNWVATDWLQRQQMVPNSQKISADKKGIAHQRVLAASVRALSNDGTSGFSFPVLNHTSSSSSSSPRKLTLNPPLEDPPRDSLEVFRPPASPKSRLTNTDDDVGSDASSDLFEIESFSTQTTYHGRDSMDENSSLYNNGRRLYCRQSLDGSMNMMMIPTSSMECYEPSEASIDWSVTTAEGFERASVANFSEADQDDYLAEINRVGGGGGGGGGGGKGGGGGGRGGLLSCRSEKAVSVGPKAVKCVGSSTRHVSSRPPIASKPPLARSHSARLSVPFAT